MNNLYKFWIKTFVLLITSAIILTYYKYNHIPCIYTRCIVLEYSDLRISGGGNSGRLEIQDEAGRWGTICSRGFDDDAGGVACSQLGYHRSSRVYTDEEYVVT